MKLHFPGLCISYMQNKKYKMRDEESYSFNILYVQAIQNKIPSQFCESFNITSRNLAQENAN